MHRVVDSGPPPSVPPHAAAFPWPAQRELAVLYTPNVLRGSPHGSTVLVRDVSPTLTRPNPNPNPNRCSCATTASRWSRARSSAWARLERYRRSLPGSVRGETGAAGMEGVAVLRNSLPG